MLYYKVSVLPALLVVFSVIYMHKILKHLFALVLLLVLFYLVDFKSLVEALSNLTWPSIVNLMLISMLLIYISAYKWKLFLNYFKSDVSVVHLFNLYLMGYFINAIFPSYVGGDAVRSWHVGKRVGQHEALAATILERYTGLVAMLLLALMAVTVVNLVTWQIRLCVVLLTVGLAVATVCAMSDKGLKLVAQLPRSQGLIRHLGKVREGLNLARQNKRLLAQALVLSFVYHGCAVLNTLVAAKAVGWTSVPIFDLCAVLPLILLIGALPLAPSGLGIQEGAFMYFLHGIGASPAEALGVGLVLRAKSYVLALMGWVVWLWMGRQVVEMKTESVK